MINAITEFLNLKADEIEDIHCASLTDEFLIELSLNKKIHTCPQCLSCTDKVLNSYTRKINHGLFINRKCTILFKQKRYRCVFCKHTFNESSDFATKYQKKSIASHMQIMDLLQDPHMTFKGVGELLNISDKTVIDTFYQNVLDVKAILPEVLCLDEVYLGRNASKKYAAVLLDFKQNRITDVIYGRSKNDLYSYLQRFSKDELGTVKYLSIDMFEGYRTLQRTYFKKAKLCVDSFHVIQLINTMFHNQLLRFMRSYETDSVEYYLLKKKKYLLLKNESSIKDWYKQEYCAKLGYTVYLMRYRELLFEIDPLIRDLYELKEQYIQFNRSRNKERLENDLDKIISTLISHNNKEVARVGRTLMKWRIEILNSFTWFEGRRISNGPIESRNNTIKLLLRNAAGYRNFSHLRKRIIYCINTEKKR